MYIITLAEVEGVVGTQSGSSSWTVEELVPVALEVALEESLEILLAGGGRLGFSNFLFFPLSPLPLATGLFTQSTSWERDRRSPPLGVEGLTKVGDLIGVEV